MKRDSLISLFVRTRAAAVVAMATKWRGVMALNYHRIGKAGDTLFDHGLWSASEEQFDEQLRYLKTDFDVVGIGDLPAVLGKRAGRSVLITFDDGYRDNYEVAFRQLKSHRLTAGFFVTTGFLDAPRLPWWDEIAWMVRSSHKASIDVTPFAAAPVAFDTPDRERAIRILLRLYKTMPTAMTERYMETLASATGSGRYEGRHIESLWMTWDMVREMRAHGMWIGGHTVDHTILAQMDADGQRSQIAGCAARLKAELGSPMASFSYPVGGPRAFNQTTRECLRECEVEYAFSYYGGIRGAADWDPYDIRRIAVECDTSFDQFQAITMLPQLFA